jgi:hypothetical protein
VANAVEICNLALGHLGSEANVASISPPDGSTEAGYCARYFPLARKLTIALAQWSFATKRSELAEVDNLSVVWQFAYSLPSNCIKPYRILKSGASTEQDGAAFTIEDNVIFTNEPNAVLVYTRDVTDTTRFSPEFISAMSWMLASYLAGPIIKGNEGANAALKLRERAINETRTASAADANRSSETHGALPISLDNVTGVQLPAMVSFRA